MYIKVNGGITLNTDRGTPCTMRTFVITSKVDSVETGVLREVRNSNSCNVVYVRHFSESGHCARIPYPESQMLQLPLEAIILSTFNGNQIAAHLIRIWAFSWNFQNKEQMCLFHKR